MHSEAQHRTTFPPGTRVQWYEDGTLRTGITGANNYWDTYTFVHDGKPSVLVGTYRWVETCRLKRVVTSRTALIPSFRELVDDYEDAMKVGDLGGTEL